MRSPAATLIVLALAAMIASSCASSAGAEHSSATVSLLAIDARSEGNTATSLGRFDGCASTGVGSLVTIDYVVSAVPQDRPLIGFEVEIRYNARLLEVVAVQNDLLLAAEGRFEPYAALSDRLPDADGAFRISIVDLASETSPEANVESGRGVLSRITFRAKMKGTSTVSIGFQLKPDLLYPLIQDTQNETIGIDHLGSATIVTGNDCPKGRQKPQIRKLPPISEIAASAR